MANNNLTNRLREMRDKCRRKAQEAYENALEIAEVAGGDFDSLNIFTF